MNLVERNEGKKIQHEVDGTKITFDDMLTIDLKRYQKEEERVIDISLDEDDILQMGLGKWYIANIVIPPKEYEFIENENEVDDEGNPVLTKVAKPLDMGKVTLTLWALPYNYGYYSLEGGF